VSKSSFHSHIPSRDIFTKEHIARYVFASRFCKGMRVLDVACGTGYGSYFLLFQGAKEVVGGSQLKKYYTSISIPIMAFPKGYMKALLERITSFQ